MSNTHANHRDSNNRSDSSTRSDHITGNHFVDRIRDTLLRGGRMTKYKGTVASFAPSMAAVALGAVLLTGSAGQVLAADECGVEGVGADTLNCAAVPYAGGITYTGSDGLTLNLDNPVIIVGSALNGVSVTSSATGTGDITVNGARFGSITTAGSLSAGALQSSIINVASTATSTAMFTIGNIITTGGTGGYGLFAHNDGLGATLAQMDGGSITTDMSQGHGVYSLSNNAAGAATVAAVVTVGAIETTGQDAHGVYVQTLGLGAVSATVSGGGTVTASGADSDGIRTEISQTASTYAVAVNDTAVVTGGSGNGAGIHTVSIAGSSGTIAIAAGAAVDGSAGLSGIVDGAGNTTMTVYGALTNGIAAGAGDDIVNLNAGSVTTGDVVMDDGSDIVLVASGADIAGVTLLDGGDDVAVADGFIDALTLVDQTLSIAGAALINWENLTVDGGNLAINDGALTVGSDAGTGLTLTNDGVLDAGAALALTGNMTTTAGGTFDGTGGGAGVYTVSGDVTNDGIITTQDDAVGDVVTISGDYTGTGELNVDVELGDSTSPTDKLVVSGDTSGTTTINVTNAGGIGALTGTGPTDGIQVVEVSGTSDPAAFALGGPVGVGAFTYDLVQADGQNWFLQTALQAQVYGYSAVQAALSDDIETLWQRVGQRERLLNMDGSVSTSGSGFWLRSVYSDTSADGNTNVSGVGVKTELDFNRFTVQAGYDHKIFGDSDGMLVAGLFGHYKNVSLKVDDGAGARLAKGDADGYGGGGSLTWYSPTGFYGDLVGQVTSWDVDVKGANGGSGSFVALTYSASVEGGYRFDINESVRFVPQAQLVWQGGNFDNFTDSNGLAVRWNEKDALTGRIGLALEGGNPVSKGGNGLTGYAIANLVYDLTGAGSVSAAGAKIKTQTNRTRVEGRLGANLSGDDEHWTLYSEVGFASALSGKDYTSFKGILGARWNF